MTNCIKANFASSINVAIASKSKAVRIYESKFAIQVLDILYNEGCIVGYHIQSGDIAQYRTIVVHLKYFRGVPVLRKLRLISTRGHRVYTGTEKLLRMGWIPGSFYILTTSHGIMTSSHSLFFDSVGGGELLYEVLI